MEFAWEIAKGNAGRITRLRSSGKSAETLQTLCSKQNGPPTDRRLRKGLSHQKVPKPTMNMESALRAQTTVGRI